MIAGGFVWIDSATIAECTKNRTLGEGPEDGTVLALGGDTHNIFDTSLCNVSKSKGESEEQLDWTHQRVAWGLESVE
jgi:hypothetical protein